MEVNTFGPYIYFQVLISAQAYDFPKGLVYLQFWKKAFLFPEIARQFKYQCLRLRALFHSLH